MSSVRRRSRARGRALAGALAGALGFALGFALGGVLVSGVVAGCGRSGPGGSRQDEDALPGGPREDSAWLDTIHEARAGVIRSGSTLQDALADVGLGAGEALRIAGVVDTVWSVRRFRAGTPFTLMVTPYGEPTEFEIWPDALEGVRAQRNAGVWEAQLTSRNLERYVRFVSGEVETSFYESIVAAGGDAELVLIVSDLLQWDVDFFVDPRRGDRYAILVEEWVDGRDVVRHGDILAIEYEGDQVQANAYRHEGKDGPGYYALDGTSVQRTLLKSPLSYRRISSHFSHRRFHPILRRYRPHLGVDYAADRGTPVVTIGDGKIVFAGARGGYGRIVIVRHNARLTTQYAHLAQFGKGIRAGVHVDQGQVIGFVGSSGLSTGPHLDFRCTVNGAFVNPLTLERPPAEPVPEAQRDAYLQHAHRYRRACREFRRSGFVPGARFAEAFDAADTGYVTRSGTASGGAG